MAHFVSCHRLDYLPESDVVIRDDFLSLRKAYELYLHKTAEFLIKNMLNKNLCRHEKAYFSFLKITFQELWEWHIRDEVVNIVNEIETHCFSGIDHRPDCVWISKQDNSSIIPEYSCEIAFFWHDKAVSNHFQEKLNEISRHNRCIAGIELLLQNCSHPESGWQNLANFCKTAPSSTLLECEYYNA